jgi:hypothetical protein
MTLERKTGQKEKEEEQKTKKKNFPFRSNNSREKSIQSPIQLVL